MALCQLRQLCNTDVLKLSDRLCQLRKSCLNPIEAYKLDSLGLIHIEGDRALVRCELYRAYFQKQLSTT